MEEEDQVQDGVQEEESEEESSGDESSEEQSTESAEEQPKLTPEKIYEITRGLQKGYTINRQDLASIRKEIDSLKEMLQSLKKGDADEYFDDEEAPITKKEFKKELVNALTELEQRKAMEQAEKDKMVDNIMSDLEAKGLIKGEKEADDFIKFTLESAKSAGLKEITPNYILSVYPAWRKVKEVDDIKKQLKSQKRGEVSSKVGNSEKGSTGEQGVPYSKVHKRDWDEL